MQVIIQDNKITCYVRKGFFTINHWRPFALFICNSETLVFYLLLIISYIYIYIYIYGIHYWRILWSSYRKVAWVGEWEIWTLDHWIPFKRSNRLSYQAMSSTRTQGQLSSATSVSSICSVSDFISAFAFVSRHVYFNRKSVEVIKNLRVIIIIIMMIIIIIIIINNNNQYKNLKLELNKN